MLKSGDLSGAATSLRTLQEYVATTEDKIRFHPAKNVVGVLTYILAGVRVRHSLERPQETRPV